MSEFTVEQLKVIANYRRQNNIDPAVTNEAVFSIMQNNLRTFGADKLKGVAVEHTADNLEVDKPQAASQVVELTEEQAKDLTIQYLSEDVQGAIEIIRRQDGGLVTDGYDSLKEFFDAELSEKNVGEVLNGEIDGIGYLQKAQEGSLTKKEYYVENKARLKNMIMKRVFEKDERSGIDFIDRHRGTIPRKDFEKLVETVIQNTIDSIPTMEGIKSMQHGLIMMDEAQNVKFLNALLEMIMGEMKKTAPLEGGMKFMRGFSAPNDYDTTEPMTFEEVYKLERGTEFNELLLENLAQKKGELNVATGAFNKYNQFATAVDGMLEEYKKSTTPISDMDGNVYIPEEPKADAREEQLLNLYQNYYAGSPEEGAAKKNLELAITKSGLPVMVTEDKEGKMSLNLSAFPTDEAKNRAINTLLRFGLQEQKSTLDKILGGKDIDSYVKAYENANTAAMGSQSGAELAKAMEEDNYSAIQVYSGGVSMAGMGLMVIGGLTGCVPLVGFGGKVALTGLAAKNSLGFTDALSREHIQSDEVKELSKGLVMDLAGFAIGGYAGQKGSQIASNLLSKGASPWVALVTEKSTDFSLSLAGDLAMMGVLQSSDTAGSLTQGNIMGIIVSTFTGIKASKEMFKYAEARSLARAVTPDGRQVALNPNDFAMRMDRPEASNKPQADVAKPQADAVSNSQTRPQSDLTETPQSRSQQEAAPNSAQKPEETPVRTAGNDFAKQQQRLKDILKDDKNISNDYFRQILGVLKKTPDNAEFILDKLEKADLARGEMINFLVYGAYKPELAQSNIILEAMGLRGKYNVLKSTDIDDLMKLPPEKLQQALDIVKSVKAVDDNNKYPLLGNMKLLAESEIEDLSSFKSLMQAVSKSRNSKFSSCSFSDETLKAFMDVTPEKRPLLEDFVRIYEKTKDCTGGLRNGFSYKGGNSLDIDELLTLTKFDADKIVALRDIYKIGSEDGENVYDIEDLTSLRGCSTEIVKMIERFARIRNTDGKYAYSNSALLADLSVQTPENIQLLWDVSQIKTSEGKPLYDSKSIRQLACYPKDILPQLMKFAKLKSKPAWSDEECAVYKNDFNTLAELDDDTLKLLFELASMKKKDRELRFGAYEVLSISGQNLEKITEIVEFMRNHPNENSQKITELKHKTLEQLLVLNGKTVDTSGLDAKQLELTNKFDEIFAEQTNLDADIIRKACMLKDGSFDEGAITLVAELAPKQRYNYHDGTEFVTNTLKNFQNPDGTVDFARYKEINSIVEDIIKNSPVLTYNTTSLDAMYSIAKRSGDGAKDAIEQTLNFISTINNADVAYESYSILKDLDGGLDEFKAVMDKYGKAVTEGQIRHYDLADFKRLSTPAGGGGASPLSDSWAFWT